MITLILQGHAPGKKNQLRFGSGRAYREQDVVVAIEKLQTQAWIQWRQAHAPAEAQPIEHPELTVRFYVYDRASDRDNKLTTILDLLQKAGVLVNDNIKRLNSRIIIEPAIVIKRGTEEYTEVFISPNESRAEKEVSRMDGSGTRAHKSKAAPNLSGQGKLKKAPRLA